MPLIATIQSRSGRRDERVGTRASAVARRGSQREQVTVYDLSPRGARFRFLTHFEPGQLVWLRLPYLEPLAATVVWVNGRDAGCSFTVPLHPAVFAITSRAMAARRDASGRE